MNEQKKYTIMCCDTWCRVEGLAEYSKLLEALRQSQVAIDHLWAELIKIDPDFFPSKHRSFKTMKLINETIEKLEGESL